jgi:hypothetical protein
LLIGPIEEARKTANWLEQTAAFGFGVRGSAIEDEDQESRILHLTEVSDVAIFKRIVKNEATKQIILLEIPIDREVLSVVLDVTKMVGIRLVVVNNLAEIVNHDVSLFNLHNQRMLILPV